MRDAVPPVLGFRVWITVGKILVGLVDLGVGGGTSAWARVGIEGTRHMRVQLGSV